MGKFFTNNTAMLIRLIRIILSHFSEEAKEELNPQTVIMGREEINCDGNYWWDDSDNVTAPLKELFNKILSEIRISKITIQGTDFNDGRLSKSVVITVERNWEIHKMKIIVEQTP